MSGLTDLKGWLDIELGGFREGLVPTKVDINRQGKTYQAIRWKRPPDYSAYDPEKLKGMSDEDLDKAHEAFEQHIRETADFRNRLTVLRFRANRWRSAAIDAGNSDLEAYYDEYIRKVDARLGGTDSHFHKLTELRDKCDV